MDSPFLAFFAEGLAAAGFRVVRFGFPYMAAGRSLGRRRVPDRLPVLLNSWREVISQLPPERLVIGGKSLGGRAASLLADEVRAGALFCLGYPFHAPGRPEHLRIDHLARLVTPTLILQGTRDPFGHHEEVPGWPLSPAIRIHWLADGDHGFAPRKASGRTERQNWSEALGALIGFIETTLAGSSRNCGHDKANPIERGEQRTLGTSVERNQRRSQKSP
jgi:predicted alpha/beta-hydrolase family hydrolase